MRRQWAASWGSAVLTGRLTQRGDGLLIGVELVDARDNNQIWGEHYNRKLSDILLCSKRSQRKSPRSCGCG